MLQVSVKRLEQAEMVLVVVLMNVVSLARFNPELHCVIVVGIKQKSLEIHRRKNKKLITDMPHNCFYLTFQLSDFKKHKK